MAVFKADILDHFEDCSWSNRMNLSDIIHYTPKVNDPTQVYNIIMEHSSFNQEDIDAWAQATLAISAQKLNKITAICVNAFFTLLWKKKKKT